MNSGQNLNNLKKFIRATNYLTVAQIFLRDNFLLNKKLEFSDIKPRLLGHWGSCPGVNHIYAHLTRSQKNFEDSKSPLRIAFMLGPGHAFPSLQANLFLEGSLHKVDSSANVDNSGIEYISKKFSWPNGFPSHASPFTPNVILEGGELGYSLSTAFGAVLDNPNLIMATVIGDGEAETGAIATAWHLNKLISPLENGVVLPILHLNKYKISGPTVFGAMSDFELIQFFRGAGWNPKIVDEYTAEDFDIELVQAFDEAFRNISKIKLGYSSSGFIRLPLLIVRSKKGSSGVTKLDGEKIEGNSASHQVPLPNAANSHTQLKALEDWLKSYNFNELLDESSTKFGSWLEEFLPDFSNRIGQNPFTVGGDNFKALDIPKVYAKVGEKSLSMNAIGNFLRDVFDKNPDNFRFFSPDETYSNKLNAIFDKTSRSWQRKISSWEKDLSTNGRVTEILSEHSLQGLIQGYILTGRHGILTSYEAFAPIVSSMMDQYAKFLAQSKGISWRGDIASLNYILTSTGWRQDHNGFSHQNPSFIDEVLRRQNGIGQIFLPADDSQAVVQTEKMLTSKNNINVLVAGKTPEPRYFSLEMSRRISANSGVFAYDLWRKTEFKFNGNNDSHDSPDLILAASGDYVFKEVIAASQILNEDFPKLKIRLVYVSEINSGGFGAFDNPLSRSHFDSIFTKDKPVHFVFHGYPQTIKSILFDFGESSRFTINGYIEKGSTTTPFDMLSRNLVSRYDIASRVCDALNNQSSAKYLHKKAELVEFAFNNSVDSPEIEDWEYLKFY